MKTKIPMTVAAKNAAMTDTDFKNTIAHLEQWQKEGKLSYAAFAVGNRSGEFFHWCLDGTTEDTLFDLASVTKVACTTTLFLIAQSEGLVHWNDPLSKYFDAPADKAEIPLWRLLSHTSGISNYKFYKLSSKPDPADAYDHILSTALSYEPGSKMVYSCLGMILIGRVLEIVYNKPLDVLYTEKIARPLKLKNSGYKLYETDAQIAVHQKTRERVNDGNAVFLNGVAGNAGLFSNIADMSIWATEIANGMQTFNVSKQIFADSIQNQTAEMSLSSTMGARALGWMLVHENYEDAGDLFPVGSFGHTGHTGQLALIDPQTGLWVVFLNNLTYHNTTPEVHTMRAEFNSALAADLFG